MESITEADHPDSCVRILEVIGNASKGGMENYIKNFLAHLPATRFRVTCICPYESLFTAALRQLKVEGVYITPIADDPPWRSIQLTMEVARLHQIDVLHAHMPKAHILAGLAGCLIQKPVVATIHGMDITSHELGVARAVGSTLITNCQQAYAEALAMGIPASRVTLVQNGVDTTLFTPNSQDQSFRKAIGVSSDTPLVGFVGRLVHEKGPDLFLRAAEYVHQIRPDVHFVMVGHGAMYQQLSDMCAHMRLEQQVHMVGWWLDTPGIYPSLDLLVHTSRSDGTSLVVLEAMSCACPVAALAVGGVPEIIESGTTGVLAGADDWESLGSLIAQLLEQPERLRTMGVAARARIQQQFDLRVNVQRTSDVLCHMALRGVNGQKVATNGTPGYEVNGKTWFDASAAKAG